MCTAIRLKTAGVYFGRTLDYDRHFGESVAITPVNYPVNFSNGERCKKHYGIIGTALITDRLPLYYDAMNQRGLCMAGLNFVGNAHYSKPQEGKLNVAQYEFILYILCHCATVREAEELLKQVNLTDLSFSDELPVAQLHWIIADKSDCITVECVKEGMRIFKNDVGVLTNNPPFEVQAFNLNNYISLSSGEPTKHSFAKKLKLGAYSRGMGGMGLPGDLSSQSRFVRASFALANSVCGLGEVESVSQFFHLLSFVEQPKGCCRVGEEYEVTQYTTCYSLNSQTYYYTTYQNRGICAVKLKKSELNGDKIISFKHQKEERIFFHN